MKDVLKALPDLHYDIAAIFTDNDFVVASLLSSATHKGEYMGLPPSENRISDVSGIVIIQFEEGKFIKEWAAVDNLSLMQQLGMELKPKEDNSERLYKVRKKAYPQTGINTKFCSKEGNCC